MRLNYGDSGFAGSLSSRSAKANNQDSQERYSSMGLPVKQTPLDWLSQLGHITLGRRVIAGEDDWLLGPIGQPQEGIEQFIGRIAGQEKLWIKEDAAVSGLLPEIAAWPLAIKPEIVDFYLRTTAYQIDVRTAWKPPFGVFGALISRFYGRRVQQLNLPATSGEGALLLNSRLIDLVDAADRPVYTIWHRQIKGSGENVFWGIYTSCRTPAGDLCVKVIFPLPQGSVTVVFKVTVDEQGHLALISVGQRPGDPGFYVIIEDASGRLWRNYISSFHEKIEFIEKSGSLQAEHSLSIGRLRVASLTYAITAKPEERTRR